jgi:hypothetical protein
MSKILTYGGYALTVGNNAVAASAVNPTPEGPFIATGRGEFRVVQGGDQKWNAGYEGMEYDGDTYNTNDSVLSANKVSGDTPISMTARIWQPQSPSGEYTSAMVASSDAGFRFGDFNAYNGYEPGNYVKITNTSAWPIYIDVSAEFPNTGCAALYYYRHWGYSQWSWDYEWCPGWAWIQFNT